MPTHKPDNIPAVPRMVHPTRPCPKCGQPVYLNEAHRCSNYSRMPAPPKVDTGETFNP